MFNPYRCSLAAGTLLGSLGVLVMVGWLTQSPALVQLLPDAPAMRFNTALLWLLVGVSLALVQTHRRRFAGGLGIVIALFAAATISQDLLGLDLGIDHLFAHDPYEIGPNPGGRMAINTALCFLLTGLTLVSLSRRGCWRLQPFLEGMAGSLICAVGGAAALGHGLGIGAAYGWGGGVGMAIHSSLGFALCGIVLIRLAVGHEQVWSNFSPRWLPIPGAVLVVTLSLVFWCAMRHERRAKWQEMTQLRGELLAAQLSAKLNEESKSLERMTTRWMVGGRPERAAWEADASAHLQDFAGMQALGWADASGKICWNTSLPGESELDTQLQSAPLANLLMSRASGSSIVMLPQSGATNRQAVVICPLVSGAQFDGHLFAVLDCSKLIDEVVAGDKLGGYLYSVVAGSQPIYSPTPIAEPNLTSEAQLHCGGLTWQVVAWPTAETLATRRTLLAEVKLGLGFLRATFFALMIFLFQQSRRRLRLVENMAQALRESQGRFRAIFDQTFQFIGLMSPDGVVLEANRSALEFAGISEADVVNKLFWETPWWTHCPLMQQKLRDAVARASQGEFIRFEATHPDRDGNLHNVDFSLKPVCDDQGRVVLLIPEGRDITEQKRAEEELTRLALLDRLTGLPNRALLIDRLEEVVCRAQAQQEFGYALLFLDFDRFKFVNDTLGHDVGDELLKRIAALLIAEVGAVDAVHCVTVGNFAARLGGDEFVVLLTDLSGPDAACEVANRLLTAFAEPQRIGAHEVHSTASIGIVVGSAVYTSAHEVIRDADTAMYAAKRAGKDRYVVFDDAMREACRRRLQLEYDLRSAISRRELSLNYQPVVSLSTAEVRSVEVRARWQHPTAGNISPAEFIPLAEESDLIQSLSQWELESACRQMVEWLAILGPLAPATISVNLSRKQFVRPDLLGTLQDVLAATGLDPSRLQLEVSEQAFGTDERAALAIAQSIRQMGIRLAIDDFGTGSSSLAAVHRFPIDTIKLNRSMLVNIEDSKDSAALMHALAVLVRNLSICMVAEGVSNSPQAIALEELGCDCGQGDFFAAPLTADEFLRFAQRSSHNQFATQGAMAFANRWSEKMVLSNYECPPRASLQETSL